MVKVVATVIATSFLPLEKAFSLMLYSNALLELSIVVSAAVSSVHWDEKCVEFILGVVARLVSVGGDTSVVVKERHLSFK